MAARSAVAFAAALALIRVAGIRTLGKQSPFDALTALVLGSVIGRAVARHEAERHAAVLELGQIHLARPRIDERRALDLQDSLQVGGRR